jgi:hypothetical protein
VVGGVFLIEELTFDPVRIPQHVYRPFVKIGKEPVRGLLVVVDEIPFGVTLLGPINLFEIGVLDPAFRDSWGGLATENVAPGVARWDEKGSSSRGRGSDRWRLDASWR